MTGKREIAKTKTKNQGRQKLLLDQRLRKVKKLTSLYSGEGKLTADDIDWGLGDYLLTAEDWIMVVEAMKTVTFKAVSLSLEEGTNNKTG